MVTIAVRVKPGAARTRVGGAYPGRNGPALVVAVTARAVDGKATEAVRRALAESLGVPASKVSLRAGAASRDKLYIVDAAGDTVDDRLRVLLSGPP